MTEIINTWIETYENDFKNKDSKNFFIELKKFDYHGKSITRIKVENGDKEKFKDFIAIFDQPWSHSHRAVGIELDESGVRLPKQGEGSHLIVQGNAIKSIKKWELPNHFRFNGITGMSDARDGILRLNIVEQNVERGPMTWFSPKVNYIEIPVGKDKVGDYDLYFNNAEHRIDEHYGTPKAKKNTEVIIENIEWEAHGGGENVTLKDGKLIIGSNAQKNVMPKIRMMHESENYPHPDLKQASNKKEVKKRVGDAIDRAWQFTIGGDKQLFRWGYTNDNKEDFQEVVLAMSDLIKIANYGSKEEKEELKNYPAWKDYCHSHFDDLRSVIKNTAKTQGWKYDLDKGEVDWGSTKTENSNNNTKNGDKLVKGAEKIKSEVQQDINKKDEEQSTKLNGILQKLSSNQTEAEREQKLKEIEKFKNIGKGYENQKEEIAEKKNELAKSDPVGYGKIIASVIQQKINEFKVEIANLGSEVKEKFNKLKNGEFTTDAEVRQIEEEVSDKVSEEVANIELNDLMNQAQNILKGSVDSLRSQLKKVKEGLWGFSLSSNNFQQKAYQKQEPKVKKMLQNLESFSQVNTAQKPKSSFFRPEIIIPLGLVVVFGVVVTAAVIRKRKRAKKVYIKKK